MLKGVPETRRTRRRAAAAMMLSAVALIAVAILIMTRKSLLGYGVVLFSGGLIILGSGIVVWLSSQRLGD